MTFAEAWAVISQGGQLAVVGVLAVVWWKADQRANEERKINQEQSKLFYELITSVQLTMQQVNNTLDKVVDLIKERRG